MTTPENTCLDCDQPTKGRYVRHCKAHLTPQDVVTLTHDYIAKLTTVDRDMGNAAVCAVMMSQDVKAARAALDESVLAGDLRMSKERARLVIDEVKGLLAEK